MENLIYNEEAIKLGYLKNEDEVIFLFNPQIYQDKLGDREIKSVKLIGSFTAWKVKWDLKKENDQLWTLEKKFEDINIPGNSGYPEFRFVINDETYLGAPKELSLENKFYDSHSGGYKLILLEDKNKAKKIKEINEKIKDYKIEYSSREELANFREIKGGDLGEGVLYRSYHPYKKSRPDHPKEDERLTAVRELIKRKGIKSIINLSDTDEDIPTHAKYYKELSHLGNIIFTNKGYNYDVFYYLTSNKEFAQLLGRIINFIIDTNNKAPFLIHCRIGTDRTGVLGAILAATMGASWEEILKDYQESNRLGIGEYRDEKLLAYAFKGLVGDSFKEDLPKKVNRYLLQEVGLSEYELLKLKDNLSGKNTRG
ncbi:tyrosine-protein phosphatase [Halonatronum saccharophilum]|uniref:tyrosine-protein phosphatase n=1 Tax=Halonatronum saccharophilum TaxID=150060 RepID=UPI00048157CC|nr:tyrosine-protein phosphatase [Halonatronum saccharophilum]